MLLRHQDRHLLRALKLYQRGMAKSGPMAWLDRLRGRLGHQFWTVVSGSDISRTARIDSSVRFPHPTGIVIHRDAVVEADCLIMQQVTLGQTNAAGAPHICRGAYLGAGAKILGPVTIGAGARVGANAVVLRDVPSGATAVGVPARILGREDADPRT